MTRRKRKEKRAGNGGGCRGRELGSVDDVVAVATPDPLCRDAPAQPRGKRPRATCQLLLPPYLRLTTNASTSTSTNTNTNTNANTNNGGSTCESITGPYLQESQRGRCTLAYIARISATPPTFLLARSDQRPTREKQPRHPSPVLIAEDFLSSIGFVEGRRKKKKKKKKNLCLPTQAKSSSPEERKPMDYRECRGETFEI
jgi:hypothetical protein